MNKVEFLGYNCSLQLAQYPSGDKAIQLISNGEPIARATVYVEGVQLGDDEACIKDYSENEGMLDALLKAGIAVNVTRMVQANYATVPVVQLSADVLSQFKESGKEPYDNRTVIRRRSASGVSSTQSNRELS